MKRHYNIYAPSWTKSYKFFRLKKTLFSNTKIYFFGVIRESEGHRDRWFELNLIFPFLTTLVTSCFMSACRISFSFFDI